MTLEGPAILALLTVFGIGAVCGALLAAIIGLTAVALFKLGGSKLAIPALPTPKGLDPNEMVAAQKALDAIAGQLQSFVSHLKQQQGSL